MMPNAYAYNNSIKLCEAKLRKLHKDIGKSISQLEASIPSKIKPVHPKGNQSWIFTERTDAETKAPILWSPDAKS